MTKEKAPEILLGELAKTIQARTPFVSEKKGELLTRLTLFIQDLEVMKKHAQFFSGEFQSHTDEQFLTNIKNMLLNSDELKAHADGISDSAEKLKEELNKQVSLYKNQLELIQNISKSKKPE